jgi:divalent metal cation (Fe/Co/Zn/Cd) transporter
MTDVAPDSLERAERVRRGVLLEYITMGYTGLEVIVGLIFGWMTGSVALMAFGADSAIELISAAALVWRLHNDEPARRELKERQALAVVGTSFMALAAYIAYGSAHTLLRHDAPEHTTVGILLVGGAVVLMPVLARAKRSVGSTIWKRGSPRRCGSNRSLCVSFSNRTGRPSSQCRIGLVVGRSCCCACDDSDHFTRGY